MNTDPRALAASPAQENARPTLLRFLVPNFLRERKRLAVAVVVVFAAGSLGLALFAARRPPGPSLQVLGSSTIDLGEGKPWEILQTVIRVRNRGSEPLVFQVDRSCNCAHLDPAEGDIQPGDVQEIAVGVQLKRKGKTESVQVRINSNDPENPNALCQLVARCPAVFCVWPTIIQFGNVSQGRTQTAHLKLLDGEGNALRPSAAISPQASSEYLTVERDLSRSDQLVFQVTLSPSCPHGYFQSNVTLKSDYSSEQETIPVSASIQGLLNVSPATLYFSPDPQSNGVPTSNLLVWRTDGEMLGALTIYEKPEGIMVEELRGECAAKRRQFRVRLGEKPLEPGRHTITLRFAGVREAATVQLVFSPGQDSPKQ